MKSRRLLLVIMLVALVVRIWFNLTSNHVYHPDEIFQTLEPAYRLVHGYGIVPWDYTYGLRSWLTPYFLALPLYSLKLLGLNQPSSYTIAIKLFLSLCSLTLIPAIYLLTKRFSRHRSAPILAAFFGAIWYETIYFSGRALTEVFATYLFAGAIILLLYKNPKIGIGSFLITLGFLLRPQYFLIPIIFIYLAFKSNKLKDVKLRLFLGLFSALLLYGMVDFLSLGFPFVSIFNNFKLSFLSGISRLFGISPWYYYLQAIIIASMGLVIIPFSKLNIKYTRVLLLSYLSILITHSLIPHKEYRFIFVLIPLFICLLSISLYEMKIFLIRKQRIFIICLIVVVSIMGLNGKLSNQYLIYRVDPLAKDPILSLNSKMNQEKDCGLFLPDRGWVTSGGYYYLGLNLPLYTFDYPPITSTSANLTMTPGNNYKNGFTYLTPEGNKQHPGYNELRSGLSCLINSSYTYRRSFEYLQPFLLYAKTY